MKRYEIVRNYKDRNHPDNGKVIKAYMTKAEAIEYCSRPDTRQEGVWFDEFREQRYEQ